MVYPAVLRHLSHLLRESFSADMSNLAKQREDTGQAGRTQEVYNSY